MSNRRYQVPVFLAVGDSRTGKSTLLTSVIPSLSTGKAPKGVERLRSGVKWFFYDDAVVLEVEGERTPSPEDWDGEEQLWRDVLRRLESYWPDRPIDGVILTISCADLVAARHPGSEGDAILSEKALAWYKRLTLAQKMLGMSFPVYVLVTKCDLLTGFQDFVQALPAPLQDETLPQDEMLGWSNPYPVANQFSAAWVDEAFEYLEDQCHTLQLELFAEQEVDTYNDGLFAFPLEVLLLRKPLSMFLSQVFRQSELHQTFAFRGLYLCGSATPQTPTSINEWGEIENSPSAQPVRPVFVRHLLERKVFVEQTLAQPVSGVALSRNHTIKVVQVALLFLLLVCAPGLYFAQQHLKEEQAALLALLTNVDHGLKNVSRAQAPLKDFLPPPDEARQGRGIISDQHEIAANQLREDSRRVRTDFAALKEDNFKSIFVPGSWFSRIHERLELSLTPAFRYIVLESLRHDLDERTADTLREAHTSKMPALVQQMGLLMENRYRYQRLAEKGRAPLDELSKLMIYVGQQPFAKNVSGKAKLYQESLAAASGPPLQIKDPEVYLAGARAIQAKIDSAYQQVLSKGFFRNQRDMVVLFGYLDEINETEQLLSSPGVSALASHRFTGASALKDLTLTSGLRELRSTLEELAGEKFMRMYAADPWSRGRALGGQHVLWERAPLVEAIKQYEEYENFLGEKFQPHSERLQSDVIQKTSDKLRSNVEQLLRQARVIRPAGLGNDLQTEIKSFKDAEELLTRLAAISAKLEMSARYDAIVTQGVLSLLLEINQQFVRASYYQAGRISFTAWDGQQTQRLSLMTFELGSQDELAAYLTNQRTQIAFVAREQAAPLISFLTARGYTTQLLRAAQTVDWAEISVQLEKHEKMVPKSSVAQLENFILEEIDKITPGQCPKAIPVTGRTSDFFLQTRDQLRQRLYNQCYALTDRDLFNRYAQLQEFYNRNLAGKFPFARISNAQSFAEADPEAMAEFYRLLDQSGKTLKDSLAKYTEFDNSARKAYEFLDQMEATRDFFAPMLVKNSPPVADLEIQFRVNQGRELCAYQIIDWELEVGRERLHYRDPARTLRWRFGDPVKLSLRWAKDSPSPPRFDGQRSHVIVIDRTATFAFTNHWSLITLFSKHLALVADYDPVFPPDPHVLSFEVWTHDGGNLLAQKETCSQEVAGVRHPLVKAFISVKLMPAGKKERLIFPDLPYRAPALDREMIIKHRSIA